MKAGKKGVAEFHWISTDLWPYTAWRLPGSCALRLRCLPTISQDLRQHGNPARPRLADVRRPPTAEQLDSELNAFCPMSSTLECLDSNSACSSAVASFSDFSVFRTLQSQCATAGKPTSYATTYSFTSPTCPAEQSSGADGLLQLNLLAGSLLSILSWMWRHRQAVVEALAGPKDLPFARQTAVEGLAGPKGLPFAPCPFRRAAARSFVTTDTVAVKPHLTVVGKYMLCDH